MEFFLLFVPVVLSFLIFTIPARYRYYYVLFLTLSISVITLIPSVYVFTQGFGYSWEYTAAFSKYFLTITIDSLSAFFILITNFTVITGLLFSKGYLKPYIDKKSPFEISLHYFSYVWLHFSMLSVLMFRAGMPFLIAWELMAVSSFILILFEGEKRTTLKTAVNYIVQMHVGFVFLLLAFLICQAKTGVMSFDALKQFFAANNNIWLFLMFFIGFGFKAGFVPLHTWLPEAHPAAPSHVSGVMSGVMIKMGIYGIVRVLTYIQSDIYTIGLFILIVSALSGVIGVMMAIVQHDLKKLLAYHSIENIGIIGMGIGMGTIGIGMNNPMLAVLGFTGGLLHVLNHSLFKSLLFFSAGSVYSKFHTRNIDQLGGVIHNMPKTATLFLIGSIAICGLPPLNGFISEILIYCGLFKGLINGNFYQYMAMLLSIIALVLIGGLAVFCFSKAFSVVFLGTSRNKNIHDVAEVSNSMLFPQYLISAVIILIGLFPVLFIKPLSNLVIAKFPIAADCRIEELIYSLNKISIIGFILIFIISVLSYIRYSVMKKKPVQYGPTWGCGYTAGTERQQYTGTSYATNFSELAEPLLRTKKEFLHIQDNDIFPAQRTFKTHPQDIFKKTINKCVDFSMLVLKRLARLQTGNIQHYVLYAFIFILSIMVLLFLKLI
jgi:hydrogenase-4 component B